MTDLSQEVETLSRNHQFIELDDDCCLADSGTAGQEDVVRTGIRRPAAFPASPRHQKSPALSALPRATYDQL